MILNLKKDIFWALLKFSKIEKIHKSVIPKYKYAYIRAKVLYYYKEYHKAELKTGFPHAKPHANLTQKQQRTHDLT